MVQPVLTHSHTPVISYITRCDPLQQHKQVYLAYDKALCFVSFIQSPQCANLCSSLLRSSGGALMNSVDHTNPRYSPKLGNFFIRYLSRIFFNLHVLLNMNIDRLTQSYFYSLRSITQDYY